jgi:2-haloacid dehalogenase
MGRQEATKKLVNEKAAMKDFYLTDIRACVFDAYGTLFDVNSAAQRCEGVPRDNWEEFAEIWRTKQLQYTWLRSLMGRHADFWQVTGEALDFALDSLRLGDAQLRDRLMALYLQLSTYPEVKNTLVRLKAGMVKCAILSNGSPTMLSAAVEHAGIADLLDAVLSVEEVNFYKPHPSVYQLAVDRLGLTLGEICFVSSNGWDAYAAKAFGLHVIWCNRFNQVPERIPEAPDGEIRILSDLPEIVGVR